MRVMSHDASTTSSTSNTSPSRSPLTAASTRFEILTRIQKFKIFERLSRGHVYASANRETIGFSSVAALITSTPNTIRRSRSAVCIGIGAHSPYVSPRVRSDVRADHSPNDNELPLYDVPPGRTRTVVAHRPPSPSSPAPEPAQLEDHTSLILSTSSLNDTPAVSTTILHMVPPVRLQTSRTNRTRLTRRTSQ